MSINAHASAHGWYHVEHWRNEELIWSENTNNQLYNEGQFMILDVALRGGTAPANWFVGLMKNTLTSLPATTSTLSTLNTAGPYELSSLADPGYSTRAQVNRDATANGWPTLAVSGSGEQASTKTVVFTNTSGTAWADTVRWMFISTVGTVGDTTGKLVSLAQLSVDRLLQFGDQLQITYNLKLT
jgi:hypothetical protein